MDIDFKFDTEDISWDEVAELFRVAPLGVRDPETLKRACENSFLVCFARMDGKLVGMGRAISDGEYQAAIYDIVVLPRYQNRGIGRLILEKIHSRLPVRTIILYAVPGKEKFYEKLGYSRMLTAMAKRNDDPGRFREDGYIE